MRSCLLIEKYRDLQLGSYQLTHPLCQMDAILHCRAPQRYKGYDVRRPHPRMDAPVLAKINEISRDANCTKGRFSDSIRFAGKAQDGTMVILIPCLVQQAYPWHGLYGLHQCTNRRLVPSLTEIRHTLDDPIHIPSYHE